VTHAPQACSQTLGHSCWCRDGLDDCPHRSHAKHCHVLVHVQVDESDYYIMVAPQNVVGNTIVTSLGEHVRLFTFAREHASALVRTRWLSVAVV